MIVTGALLFIALVFIGVGIWFVINTDRYTKGITAEVIKDACQISPGPAPECVHSYSFKVEDDTYIGKLDEKLTTSTVKISYDPSDPNINRKGDPDNKYLGPVLIGSGVVMGVIGVVFSLR